MQGGCNELSPLSSAGSPEKTNMAWSYKAILCINIIGFPVFKIRSLSI